MEARSKWLWTVTVANVAVAALLLLVIYSIMLAQEHAEEEAATN